MAVQVHQPTKKSGGGFFDFVGDVLPIAGAIAGSVVPGVGTALGANAGAIAGGMAGAGAGNLAGGAVKSVNKAFSGPDREAAAPAPAESPMSRRMAATGDDTFTQLRNAATALPELPPEMRQMYAEPIFAALKAGAPKGQV